MHEIPLSKVNIYSIMELIFFLGEGPGGKNLIASRIRPYFSTPTVITFGVSFELLLFLTSNVKLFERQLSLSGDPV
jgi:hypothetical protein